MGEYMGGPYNSRSNFNINVDGTVITGFKFAQKNGGVVLQLVDANEQQVGEDIPFPDATDSAAGAFTTALNKLLSDTSTNLITHMRDDNMHITANERQIINDLSGTDPISTNLSIDIPSGWTEIDTSGTIKEFVQDLVGNSIFLKNAVETKEGIAFEQSTKDNYDTYLQKLKDHLDTVKSYGTDDTPASADIHYPFSKVTKAIEDRIASSTTTDTFRVTPKIEVPDEYGNPKPWRDVRHLDDGGWYAVDTMELDYTGKINSPITYGYGYVAPKVISGVKYPATFKDKPMVFISVVNSYAQSDNYQGVGVWAVCSHDGDEINLPTIRLQCASAVTTDLVYRIYIRVEGYIVS